MDPLCSIENGGVDPGSDVFWISSWSKNLVASPISVIRLLYIVSSVRRSDGISSGWPDVSCLSGDETWVPNEKPAELPRRSIGKNPFCRMGPMPLVVLHLAVSSCLITVSVDGMVIPDCGSPIFVLVQGVGLPYLPTDDATPSLSMHRAFSNSSRYKSPTLGIHPPWEPSATPRNALRNPLWECATQR